jgi:ATP-dependent DNA helicase RecQ
LDPEGGHLLLELDLRVAPERLGTHTGEHNRGWNRTLLNLMHRAGAITILQVDAKTDRWKVEIPNPALVDGDLALLQHIFSLRDQERRQAQTAFDTFVEVLEGDFCLLAETFRLIEHDAPFVPDCGRCGPCRRALQASETLETVRFQGLTGHWKQPWSLLAPPPWPGAVLVEHEVLDKDVLLSEYLPLLARLGYAQFLVPDDWAPCAAERLRDLALHPGLVLGFEEWSTQGWQLYDLPTAALLDLGPGGVYTQAFLRTYLQRPRSQRPPMLVLARQGHALDGKRLAQRMDTCYPLSTLQELMLDSSMLGAAK